MLTLTTKQVQAIDRYLWGSLIYQGDPPLNGYGYHGISHEQYESTCRTGAWGRGGPRAWNVLQQGGTGVLAAICWYQHIHKPGSREWRPSIIIRALLQAAETERA